MGDSLHTNVPVINKFRPISSFRNANWAMGKVQGTSRRGGRPFREGSVFLGIRLTGKFGLGGNFRQLLF